MPARTDQRMPNALPAAIHVERSWPAPWQRGAALSPLVTDGTPPRRTLDFWASRSHELRGTTRRVGVAAGRVTGAGALPAAGLRTLRVSHFCGRSALSSTATSLLPV